MLRNVREIAAGRWAGILVALGFDSKVLNGKHQPCPNCGGTDRFRFDNKGGKGTFYCSHCGAGDGVELVMRVKDWDFKTAVKEIEQVAGFVKPEKYTQAKSDEAKLNALKRMWSESRPVTTGDPVHTYLSNRGLRIVSDALRLHPGLTYRDGAESSGRYPAMLAKVVSPDGKGVSIHRTYLKDGKKAPVPSPKKLMPGLPLSGAAIRLFPAGPCLGIAEGIETAVAASMLFKVPVWSCISAGGIESFAPPEGVKSVIVFADCDESFTGQAAAYAFAKRMKQSGIEVSIEMPGRGDWCDELAARR